MPRLEESDSGHNLHFSRSHGYRQPLSPGRFQVESHRAPPVQPNQQKLGWRTPHRHRQDPQVHPYHQNGIRPYRQCVSHPRELRHRNQDLRRGNASTQPRSPRNARALELYRTPHSECELILGHRLRPISKPRGWPDVITVFLRSLMQYWGGKLIAVIVSGYDGDGAAALCGIKEVGGVTIAQKLDTAGQPDMPESAIASGCIDFVLSPEDIAKEIVRIAG